MAVEQAAGYAEEDDCGVGGLLFSQPPIEIAKAAMSTARIRLRIFSLPATSLKIIRHQPSHQQLPYFIVGMTNSAPLRMPVGQRVVIVFRCE